MQAIVVGNLRWLPALPRPAPHRNTVIPHQCGAMWAMGDHDGRPRERWVELERLHRAPEGRATTYRAMSSRPRIVVSLPTRPPMDVRQTRPARTAPQRDALQHTVLRRRVLASSYPFPPVHQWMLGRPGPPAPRPRGTRYIALHFPKHFYLNYREP